MRDIKKYSAWDILEYLKIDDVEKFNQFVVSDKPKQKSQLWFHRFDDQVIRSNKMFWQKLKYIHNNPVKAGLVLKPEDHLFSSARNYIKDDHSVIDVGTDFVGSEMVDLIV